jgi:thioesterase domain-containing protein/acyl carrier protein
MGTTPNAEPGHICVLGATPAGLVAARLLEATGYGVTVLEPTSTIPPTSSPMLGPRSEHMAALATELGMQAVAASSVTLPLGARRTVAPLREAAGAYLALRERLFPDIGEPELALSAAALCQPVRTWLGAHRAELLASWCGAGFTAAGLGYLDDDLPMLYFAKYIEASGALSLKPPVLGHVGGFVLADGEEALWEQAAAELSDVRYGVDIEHIDRSGDVIRVQTATGTVVTDHLLIATSIDQALPLLTPTAAEKELAGLVRYRRHRLVTCRVTGLPSEPVEFVLTANAADRPAGRCAALRRVRPGSDEFIALLYVGPNQTSDAAVEMVRDDLAEVGGSLVDVSDVNDRRAVPHFAQGDVDNGAYRRLAALQGENRTYHLGELPGFALTESAVAHALWLVRRHFVTGSDPDAHVIGDDSTDGLIRTGIGAHATAEQVRDWLVGQVAKFTWRPVDEVTPTRPLVDLGLNSLSALAILTELQAWLGVRLDHAAFMSQPTIGHATDLVIRQRSRNVASGSAIIAVTEPVTGVATCFWFPGGAGETTDIRPIAERLGLNGMALRIPTPDDTGADALNDFINAHLTAIQAAQPQGPYLMAGHSIGGLIGYEVARRLHDAGREVRFAALDTGTHRPLQDELPEDGRRIRTLEALLYTARLTRSEQPEYHIDWSRPYQDLLPDVAAAMGSPEPSMAQYLDALSNDLLRRFLVTEQITPGPVAFPLLLVTAADGLPPMRGNAWRELNSIDRLEGWAALPDLKVIDVPGNHYTMMYPPHADQTAAILQKFLLDSETR